MKTNHYIVKGIVQGVSFRFYTLRAARKYGIKGTVKNLFNGDVEVYAQGDKVAMEEFKEYLHRGPISASVDQVLGQECESEEVFTDFEIVY